MQPNLICALRETGPSLDAIREVLSYQLTLGGAPRLLLAVLEAENQGQRGGICGCVLD